ncbi:hypothetical protein E4U57_007519 [Claviceps arundinis]|uniref:Polyketide synthase n=1 Tax=Claviceps arundinis TaxID=1623583 RepID=A0ABQ7P0Z8_9HYPO|nr:hypothetical protein E4U57_007519 [Claviceps arundinis]
MADMNLDGDVTRTHSQEQIIIAAVNTQTFAAMVDKGIRYGCLNDLPLAVGSGDVHDGHAGPRRFYSSALQLVWRFVFNDQQKLVTFERSKYPAVRVGNAAFARSFR